MINTIEQRAEAYADFGEYDLSLVSVRKRAYIAGATEERVLMEQQTASLEERVKELEGENTMLKRKLKIAENAYWNELE